MMQEYIDQPSTSDSIVVKLSPKYTFFLGLAASLAVLFMIGFFVLLTIILSGNSSRLSARSDSGILPPALPPSDTSGIALTPVTEEDWVRGNRSAKISVVEFSDTECPFCKRFHPTMQQVVATYGDKVNWVYRHFPITSLHPKAPQEAAALECAGELGGNEGFWKYTDQLFAVTPSNNNLDLAQLPQIAAAVGLSQQKFQTCLDSGKYAAKVQSHLTQAAAAGCDGTPCSFVVVGEQKIPVAGAVPLDQLKAIIDPLLK